MPDYCNIRPQLGISVSEKIVLISQLGLPNSILDDVDAIRGRVFKIEI